jgi:hypothetical protein
MADRRWRVWVVPALASLILACQHGAASPPASSAVVTELPMSPAEQDQVPGEWLVTVRPGVNAAALLTRYRALGVLAVTPVSADLFLLRFAPDRSPSAAQVRAAGATDVVAVQPNFRYRAFPSPGPRLK